MSVYYYNRRNILVIFTVMLSICFGNQFVNCTQKPCETITNETVEHNQKWINLEDCNECHCQNGILRCIEKTCEQPKSCLYLGKIYSHNESWSYNNCTNCVCENGRSHCYAYFCYSEVAYNSCKNTDIKCPTRCPFGYEIVHNNDTYCSQCFCKYSELVDQFAFWILKNFTTQDLTEMQRFLQQHNYLNSNGDNIFFIILFVIIGLLIATAITLLILLYRERRKMYKKSSFIPIKHEINFISGHDYKQIPLYDTNFNSMSQHDFNLNSK